MVEEINFMDLAVLLKITPNTPLERLGGIMNSSIFDASNIAGSMKQKGLIEFTAYYPGPNSINITDAGKALIAEADARAAEPFDQLDGHILQQLSGGKRIPLDLQNTLNLRPKDLALRLYKGGKQGFLIYEIKNGTIDLMLTEKGFLQAKGGTMQVPPMGAVAAASAASSTQQVVQQKFVAQSPPMPDQMQGQPNMPPPGGAPPKDPMAPGAAPLKGEKTRWIIIAVLVIILVVLYFLIR